jgi:hypothetical protein
MHTITLTLTAEDLFRLTEGSRQFGACALVAHAEDGTPIYVTVANGKRPKKERAPKPPKAESGASAGEAAAAPAAESAG